MELLDIGRNGMMAKRCYYESLSIERTATETDIKSAFRKQAMQCHPDRNPGDKDAEHRFKEINEAYEVLKDPDKRAAYDRFGHAAFEQGNGMAGAHGFGADFATTFSDIFDDLFGMGGRRGRGNSRERGADLRYNMEISLHEAYAGKAAQVRIPTSVTCEACSGSGAKPGSKPKVCTMCQGHGKVRHAQGFFTLSRSTARARRAQAPAGSPASARCQSTFQPELRTARASALPARARPACAADRRETFTSSCLSRRIHSSSAKAPICIAVCRFRW
jgi:DnaJ-class molecular chaperone